jgi:hypothetical protein
VYWTDTADGHRCTRHNLEFRRGEVCQRCVADPGDEIGGIEFDEQEVAGLKSRIAELRSKARTMWRIAEELLGGTDRDCAAACKVTAEHTKLLRLAEELQAKVDGYVRDDRLVRKEAQMSGQRKRN